MGTGPAEQGATKRNPRAQGSARTQPTAAAGARSPPGHGRSPSFIGLQRLPGKASMHEHAPRIAMAKMAGSGCQVSSRRFATTVPDDNPTACVRSCIEMPRSGEEASYAALGALNPPPSPSSAAPAMRRHRPPPNMTLPSHDPAQPGPCPARVARGSLACVSCSLTFSEWFSAWPTCRSHSTSRERT